MSQQSAIYIAATGQNVGKTTLCLGILSALKKRIHKLGFIKPVGQRHITLDDGTSIDKDVVLFKEYFDLPHGYSDMSPVLIPSGFTKEFLNGEVETVSLEKKILAAYSHISNAHTFTLVEGTGHVGVGSIVGLCNARVASLLGLDMVIIASGGLGSAFDELALNIALCKTYGVNVRGVILNRVQKEKREMIENYFPKALKAWNVPLLGCIPYSNLLSRPTMQDFESLFETKLLSGERHRCRHFDNNRLVAASLESFHDNIAPKELVITPACREDIIRSMIDRQKSSSEDFEWGLILTGTNPPTPEIIAEIRRHEIPVLYAPLCSYDAMKKITTFVAKIRIEDTSKVQRAIELVEQHINFDQLCQTIE